MRWNWSATSVPEIADLPLGQRMPTIEARMNNLTEMNSGWWPFLHLRPSRSQDMDNRTLLRLSLHFGPFYGLILALVFILLKRNEFSLVPIVVSIVVVTVYFFVAYKFTFAAFWNSRARRLRAEEGVTRHAT